MSASMAVKKLVVITAVSSRIGAKYTQQTLKMHLGVGVGVK
jgi:hypothetical protein